MKASAYRPKGDTVRRGDCKLTAASHAIMVARYGQGGSYRTSADAAGISIRSFMRWLTWGQNDLKNNVESDYAIFAKELFEARANTVNEYLKLIKEAAPTDAKAAMWWICRYERKDVIDISGATASEKFESLFKVLRAGKITADEAVKIGSVIEKQANLVKMQEFEAMLMQMQQQLQALAGIGHVKPLSIE